MDFVSTWKVNTEALSPHGWVGLLLWVGVQTALLSLLFTACTCLPMQAPSTFSVSLAQARVDGTALEQGEDSVLVVLSLGCTISVFHLHRPSSAPLQGTTWIPTI